MPDNIYADLICHFGYTLEKCVYEYREIPYNNSQKKKTPPQLYIVFYIILKCKYRLLNVFKC